VSKLSVFRILLVATIIMSLFMLSGCGEKSTQKQVVVYTGVDQVFSEPILKEFEKQTGIKVLPVYDVEAAKTTGLINRLIAESSRPKADVFWSNEYAQMIVLKEKGVLSPYNSIYAEDIPDQYRDPEFYWTGFAGRARVIIVNTELVDENEYPHSIYDIADPKWKNEVGIANPLFGTTASFAAALFDYLGEKEAHAYFQSLLDNDVHIVDGNSVVRDMVANGELQCGFVDSDDAIAAINDGEPVAMIIPDQQSIGTLLIPNTVGLIKGATHSEEARQLIDYLLSKKIEEALASSSSIQIPLRNDIPTPTEMRVYGQILFMQVLLQDVADKIDESSAWLQQNFYR
jgi:iron(III) transport system substrate-binding protein